jgi:hypothetical protein
MSHQGSMLACMSRKGYLGFLDSSPVPHGHHRVVSTDSDFAKFRDVAWLNPVTGEERRPSA